MKNPQYKPKIVKVSNSRLTLVCFDRYDAYDDKSGLRSDFPSEPGGVEVVDLNYRTSTKINYSVNEVIIYDKGLMIKSDIKIILIWLNLVIIITTGSVRYTVGFFKANDWIVYKFVVLLEL